MKYTTHQYAYALAAIAGDPKTKASDAAIVKNFFALLRKNGDESHAHKIIEITARIMRGQGGVRKVMIESARKLSPAQKKIVAAFLKEEDVVQERIDPALIAGIRLIVDDEAQLDGSLRGKIDNVFHNI